MTSTQMTATREFLARLTAQKIKLEIEGDQLRVEAAKGALTPDLIAELRAHKADIIRFLGSLPQSNGRPPILPIPRTQLLAPSFAQERLWLLQQLEMEKTNVIPAALSLYGVLDVAALQESLTEIVKRHESLRTTFAENSGGTRAVSQVIQPLRPVELPVVDLRHLNTADQQTQIAQHAKAETLHPFDLTADLMIRAKLLRLGADAGAERRSYHNGGPASASPVASVDMYPSGVPGDKNTSLDEEHYILLLTMHHIAADGWSIGVLIHELNTLYAVFATGAPSPLPALTVQYADFAQWQRTWLQGDLLETQLGYWRKQLTDAAPRIDLPTDHPHPLQPTLEAGREQFSLDSHLTQQVKELSQKNGTSLFTTLLAVFNLLLSRYSGQEDLVVATPIAGRTHQELEPLIGFFINRLLLRSNTGGNPSFLEFLVRTRQMTQEAYDHQDVPFEKLVQELQPERVPNRYPFSQVTFALQNNPMPPLKLPGLEVELLEPLSQLAARADLEIHLWEVNGQLKGQFVYSGDLFEAATIQRLISHYQTLLQAVVADPNQRISELPMLTETERRQILVEWNAPQGIAAIDAAQTQCLHHMVEAQAMRTPDAVAIVLASEFACADSADGHRDQATDAASNCLTYAELNSRANQLARRLQQHGAGVETLVGVYLNRSLDLVVALLGILKAGAAYVPLDPAYPAERLAFILADTQSPLLITQRQLYTTLPDHTAQVVLMDEDLAELDDENLTTTVQPENLAYVIYTSGSTGTPNGVLVEHRGLCNSIASDIHTFGIYAGARLPHVASFNFDAATSHLFMGLCAGATIYLVERPSEMIGAQLTELLANAAITHAIFPVSILAALPVAELPALKVLGAGADVCPPEIVMRWGQERRFFNVYGPTEATITTTIGECAPDGRKPSIGRPIANMQTYILDRNQQPVPIGVAGELYIGGVGVARSYLNRPKLTAQKFVPVSSLPPDVAETILASPQPHPCRQPTLYRSGDLARYRADGSIEFFGRIDNQIKVRGYRIEPDEVNSALTRHPAVKESLVTVAADPNGEKRLIAYFVPHSSSGSDEQHRNPATVAAELRDYLQRTLPPHMVPSAFVPLVAMPLTPNGKIDLDALPAPEATRRESYRALRTATETELAAIWSELLGVETIGVEDDFFALGGNSILVLSLVSALEDHFAIKLPVQSIFAASSIEALAQRIDALRQPQRASSAPDDILEADATLDPTIQPAATATSVARYRNARTILLTGATGFLGAHLLADLLQQTEAEIYCLVRAADEHDGLTRIQKNLTDYALWQETYSQRIKPILGDLGQPWLGLGETAFGNLAAHIDVIYHNGALVNFVLPYSALKAANVLGTQEVLRFACQHHTKPVHFVSTLSILRSGDRADGQLIRENDPLLCSAGLENGYVASKWVAERLMFAARERGIPVTIYRPRRISGHSQSGLISNTDLFCRMLTACMKLGMLPERGLWGEWVDMTPVDFVSAAIVHLSKQEQSLGKVFHIRNPQPIARGDLQRSLEALGYPLKLVDYATWRAALVSAVETQALNPLHDLSPFIAKDNPQVQQPLFYDFTNLQDGLDGTSITCPPVDQNLLHTYLLHFERNGLL